MLFRDTKDRMLFIEEKLSLVQKIVIGISSQNHSIEDFYQVGCVGLIKAIDNYNELEEKDFDIFATSMIKRELIQYIELNKLDAEFNYNKAE